MSTQNLSNMRKITLFLMLFCAKVGFAQVVEDFNNNDLKQWSYSGNPGDLAIIDGQLKSTSTSLNSSLYASIPNSLAINVVWEFWMNLRFNTSNANYVDVYLISDRQDLKSPDINGYFLRVGGTSDEISLFKREGSISAVTKITDGINGVTNKSNNLLKIKVARDSVGYFTVYYDTTGSGQSFQQDGEVLDTTIMETQYFGFYIQQSTASFVTRHYFDDVHIQEIVEDQEAPSLLSVLQVSEGLLQLSFSEAVDKRTALACINYQISPEAAFKVQFSNDEHIVLISFDPQAPTGVYTLKVDSIRDLHENVMLQPAIFDFFHIQKHIFQWGDVRINEVMIDPSPPLELPNAEFIELWNLTDRFIKLAGWKLQNNSTLQAFPADTIAPNQLVILTSEANRGLFESYGKVIGFSSWSALRNESGTIGILSQDSTVIDSLSYDLGLYKDQTKINGGYSLELVDPDNSCPKSLNWMASVDAAGGSPGSVNSVYKSQYALGDLELLSAELTTDEKLILNFSKFLNPDYALVTKNYIVNNGVGKPDAVFMRADFKSVEIHFNASLRTGLYYELRVDSLRGCGDSELSLSANTITFFKGKKIERGDILISEILMNPKSGGADFLEIFNASEETLNLKGLTVANSNSLGQPNIKRNVDVDLFVEPQGFLVLTPSTKAQLDHYTVLNPMTLNLFNLPSFALAAGGVFIMNEHAIIDDFQYSQSMHHPLLTNVKGVSLERVSFDRPANQDGNFLSASATSGYATPGYENSSSVFHEKSALFTSSDVYYLSKGEEGLRIFYELSNSGLVGTIAIHNYQGRHISTLLNNGLLGTSGNLSWSGADSRGVLVSPGIYYIVLEVFDKRGKRQKWIKRIVVG